ncbi:MAG: hypothetical protein WCK98_03565 [bacterium]
MHFDKPPKEIGKTGTFDVNNFVRQTSNILQQREPKLQIGGVNFVFMAIPEDDSGLVGLRVDISREPFTRNNSRLKITFFHDSQIKTLLKADVLYLEAGKNNTDPILIPSKLIHDHQGKIAINVLKVP